MSRVAAIGEQGRVQGFSLAGAEVRLASTPEEVRAAWLDLPEDVAVVILTPSSAQALQDVASDDRLTVVMPA